MPVPSCWLWAGEGADHCCLVLHLWPLTAETCSTAQKSNCAKCNWLSTDLCRWSDTEISILHDIMYNNFLGDWVQARRRAYSNSTDANRVCFLIQLGWSQVLYLFPHKSTAKRPVFTCGNTLNLNPWTQLEEKISLQEGSQQGYLISYHNIRVYNIYFFTLALAEISWTPLFAASLMMGVMRPLSVATAIEMWIESSARGPSPDQVTFTSGIS